MILHLLWFKAVPESMDMLLLYESTCLQANGVSNTSFVSDFDAGNSRIFIIGKLSPVSLKLDFVDLRFLLRDSLVCFQY